MPDTSAEPVLGGKTTDAGGAPAAARPPDPASGGALWGDSPSSKSSSGPPPATPGGFDQAPGGARRPAPKPSAPSNRKVERDAKRATKGQGRRKSSVRAGSAPGADDKNRRPRRKPPRAQRPPRWRGRILPKSILGISLLMLAFGTGMAASGVGLYLYYQYRVDTSDQQIKNFKGEFKKAKDTIRNESVNARAQIQAELEPLRKVAATGQTLETLLTKVQPSVWTVSTFDVAGAPIVGSSFVVASDAEKSFLLTSYSVTKAATTQPGPDILVRKGADERKATLWTWDEKNDLALLIIDQGRLPRLDWAAAKDLRLGDRVFAVSGLGTAGGAITSGYIADVSATGIQHDAAVGTAFQGGPILDSDAKVVSVGSRTYAPLGFPSDGVYFGIPITAACEKVLSCPGGRVSGAGPQAGH